MKLAKILMVTLLTAIMAISTLGLSASAASTKLKAPTGFSASEKTTTSLKLKWKEVKGADGYRVFIYNSSTKKYTKYADVLENNCVVTGLSANKKYKFKVSPLVFTEQKQSKAYSTKTASKDKTDDRNIGTDKSITLTCDTKLPVEIQDYWYGEMNSKCSISDYTYEAKTYDSDEYNLEINLKGEATYWNNEESDQSVQITLLDEEGYSVETKRAYRNITGLGKFKDLSATFYDLAPGKYTFTVSDYGSGDKPKSEEEKADKLNGCTIDLPATPTTISYYDYNDKIKSSCNVTAISCEVDGDDLSIFFSGKKTYDAKGSGQSAQCLIGWKLYEISSEGDIVIESGTAYTLSLKEGELFRNTSDTAYNCIEKGKHYRLEIMGVN